LVGGCHFYIKHTKMTFTWHCVQPRGPCNSIHVKISKIHSVIFVTFRCGVSVLNISSLLALKLREKIETDRCQHPTPRHAHANILV